MSTVSIKEVDKFYGPVQVLQAVSLEIADGEFIVLVGPSGCGKSTLLRIVSGLEPLTHGDISIDGRIVTHEAPKDRDIAMVFQSYALYPHMTVRENLAFSMKIRKESQANIDKSVEAASDILGLSELLNRLPKQLSGGQRQRVAMGRAIVRDPKVFLFDEPLSNLDAKLRIQMRKEIKALHQRLKSTIIYVTHDQIEAMTMADRVVVMKDGFIEQVGSPLELYDMPCNKFVAGFIGAPSMNFLDAEVVKSDQGLSASVSGVLIPIPEETKTSIGDSIVIGIRPEHITLSQDSGLVKATVSIVEPTGAETMVDCTFAGNNLQIIVKDRVDFDFEDTIYFSMDANKVHVFNANSGLRL